VGADCGEARPPVVGLSPWCALRLRDPPEQTRQPSPALAIAPTPLGDCRDGGIAKIEDLRALYPEAPAEQPEGGPSASVPYLHLVIN
jgi:hypothetical protein